MCFVPGRRCKVHLPIRSYTQDTQTQAFPKVDVYVTIIVKALLPFPQTQQNNRGFKHRGNASGI